MKWKLMSCESTKISFCLYQNKNEKFACNLIADNLFPIWDSSYVVVGHRCFPSFCFYVWAGYNLFCVQIFVSLFVQICGNQKVHTKYAQKDLYSSHLYTELRGCVFTPGPKAWVDWKTWHWATRFFFQKEFFNMP